MALFTTPTIVSTTNSTLISAIGAVGTVANVATNTLNATAQVVDMAAIKIDVVHHGVTQAAKLDKEDSTDSVIQQRAMAAVELMEKDAKLLGNKEFNKAAEYDKLKVRYTKLLKTENTPT